MDSGNRIAIAAIVTAAAVALLIAYQNRRQARHLELYRQDSKAGLKPPDTAIVQWLKRHGPYVVGVVMCLWGLSQQWKSGAPPSRHDVVIVALEAAGLVLMSVLDMLNGLLRLLARIVDALDKTLSLPPR